MTSTLPLAEFIKQLQEMENKNPGIVVALNDQEWGIGMPTIQIQKVYKDDKYEGLNPINENDYASAMKGVEDYKNMDWQNSWDLMG